MKNQNPFWEFFCSLKLTIVLLLALALSSIFGTLIPQNESPAAYLNAYGAFWYQLLSVLGFLDMYRSWWFQGLLLLLTINIVACSIDRLKSGWKVIFNRNPQVRPERFTRRSDVQTLTEKRNVDDLVKAYEPIIAARYRYRRIVRNPDGAVIYGEKGRLSRLGVYVVHLSVIFLLIGGLVGSFWGFKGFVNIPEGEATDVIRIRSTGMIHRLDFKIRCDRFVLERWDSGSPREYRSSLTLLQGDKILKQKDIIVNDPLRFRGINIFQSSYGQLPPDQFPPPQNPALGPADTYTLHFTSQASGMNYIRTVKVGDPIDIPEGLGQFVVTAYEADTTFGGMDIGAGLHGILTPVDGEPEHLVLPFQFPKFDKMRGGEVTVSIANPSPETQMPSPPAGERYYTGLQVTRDPGVGLVYTGFILMIVGIFVSFYLTHQQVCIVIEQRGKSCRVTFSGISNRNKLAMNHTKEKIFKALTDA